MFLICSAWRICSFCLLFCCSNIVVFLVRIFCNSVVEHECFFKCSAMELVSERCTLSLLNRVVEVKPTYIFLFSEILLPKGHLNWYSFLTVLFMNKLNIWLKMLTNKINTVPLHPVNKHLSIFFYHNQMHYNYKLHEKY